MVITLRPWLRAARSALLFVGAVAAFGCKGVLGIEERKLDVSELSASGYDGCVPSNGVCDACTSPWHTCICEGWESKPEAVLRRDCADEAPAEIRDEVERRAEEAYEEYRASLDASAEQDSGGDDTRDDAGGGDTDDVQPGEPKDGGEEDDASPSDDDSRDDGATDSDDSPDASTSDDASEPDDTNDDDGETDDASPSDGGVDLSDLSDFNEQLCVDPPGTACLGCLCGQCGDRVNACKQDRGCAEIMNCILTTGCDPSPSSGVDSCANPAVCGDVFMENGGPSSEAFELFDELMVCRAEESCPCGNAQGPEGCNPQEGCSACPDCWGRCFCEGKSDAQCQDECGNANCTQQQNCLDCSDCIDQCLCIEEDREFCLEACAPPGGPNCRVDRACDCNNCFDECMCNGGDFPECEAECGFGPSQICDPAVSCNGCSTCGGTCYCDDPTAPLNECLDACDLGGCAAGECVRCESCQARCECEGRSPEVCLAECQGLDCEFVSNSQCDSCACDSCTSQFAACLELPDCPPLMDCIQRTGCINPMDCSNAATCGAEVAALGGPTAPAMGIVEALQACRISNYCPCFGAPVPQDLRCGDVTCTPLILPAPDPIAPPCCPADLGNTCGYSAEPLFGNAFSGLCLERNAPGRSNPACANARAEVGPFAGDELLGCCRPEGICGFVVQGTDLGCLAPELLRVATEDFIPCDY